jgi:hypothetical protein
LSGYTWPLQRGMHSVKTLVWTDTAAGMHASTGRELVQCGSFCVQDSEPFPQSSLADSEPEK